MSEQDDLLELAERAARLAGDLLLERFRRPATGLSSKSSQTDLVSDADRDAERLLRDLLLGERPADGLLGEEGGGVAGTSGLRWVVDPLDGTVNYLYGLPSWSVSIACEDAEGGRIGVVHVPTRNETFTAVRGGGAWLDGARLAASGERDLPAALVSTGFSYRSEERQVQARALATMLGAVRDIRRSGSAAIDLASVAAGRVDGFYEHGLNAWDSAAGTLLVREAGGRVVPLPATAGLREGIVAAGADLAEPLVALVERALGGVRPADSLH